MAVCADLNSTWLRKQYQVTEDSQWKHAKNKQEGHRHQNSHNKRSHKFGFPQHLMHGGGHKSLLQLFFLHRHWEQHHRKIQNQRQIRHHAKLKVSKQKPRLPHNWWRPAEISQNFSIRRSGAVCSRVARTIQQRRRKRPGCGTSQKRPPFEHPRLASTSAQRLQSCSINLCTPSVRFRLCAEETREWWLRQRQIEGPCQNARQQNAQRQHECCTSSTPRELATEEENSFLRPLASHFRGHPVVVPTRWTITMQRCVRAKGWDVLILDLSSSCKSVEGEKLHDFSHYIETSMMSFT